ncbi:MAG TPA: MASE1 domain-containing protein [Arenimonas sp.]|uniref:MASE1 domain-containing protein n=1 Tax=Arenimonas sp. TaxID=1872635 RepID=UPI002D7E9E9C|nr:MASE1 domain-containing protein [Arenimonas sp.]HEU0154123.1 MASE1 domain-containing protein [Arenimonas sp.]
MRADPLAPYPGTALRSAWPAAAAFGLGYWLLLVLGFLHWHVATGLLFLALWLQPRRQWPALVLATILVRCLNGLLIGWRNGVDGGFLHYWHDATSFVLGNLLEPFLVMAGVALLCRANIRPLALAAGDGIERFLVAALVAAALLAAKDVGYVLNEGSISDIRLSLLVDTVRLAGDASLLGFFAVKNLLGHFIGMLLVVPLGAWIAEPRHHPGSRRILGEAMMLAPLFIALLSLVAVARESAALAELLRMLVLVAVVVFSMRHGWRGAVLSLLSASVLIALEDHLGLAAQWPVWLQLFIAIAGTMALMFGATVDGLRRQSAELAVARRRQLLLAEELHDAAIRNLKVEERERQRLAGELHDEFGQNLAALQTHLKLSAPDLAAAGRAGVVDRLLEITRAMQQNIGRVLDSLRPAALDELGLFGAIDRGSLRRLVEDAGLVFETRLEGDARLLARLNPVHRVAAFRIAQESITNIVRHSRARHCSLRLRVSARDGQLCVFLDIRDDGCGRVAELRPGNGMTGLQDRILALGGRLVISQLRPGLRVHAVLRQPLRSPDPGAAPRPR